VKNRGFHIGRPRLPLRRWVPYALLLLSCLLSVAVALYVAVSIQARARAAFLSNAEGTRQQIEGRVNSYLEVTRAAAALFASSNEKNPAEFRSFITHLALPERYPGLEGIGFSQRIARRDLNDVVRAINLDSPTQLTVSPRGPRPEYYPIVFLEPTAGGDRRAIGFDMWTDAVQRAAMENARDSGEPTLSDKVGATEPFEVGVSGGFILYVPIYRSGATIRTVADRRRALVGFVFSSFHPVELFTDIVEEATPSVAFEVYDGADPQPTALLHRSADDTTALQFQSAQLVHGAGREWLMIVRSLGGAVVAFPLAAQWTLVAGLLLSLMLFVMTRVQVRAWEASAHHQAVLEASEHALRESESQLRDLVVREREARTQAQEADHSKDEFLAMLSHELRTPLNAVLGWLSMLRTGTLAEERRQHALQVIDRNARLQAHLIEDLLDVSRIVTGKMRLELQPLTVATIASAVVESLRPAAEEGGVRLDAAIVPGTGNIYGDIARVEQIIWNLLSNAIKFTPRDGRVSVELTEEQSFVQLSVSDTGVGIAPEFLPHVFERFRQADSSTTRPHTGVGLGLAITRCLAELHGGTVEAHSEGVNRGARFVLRLPANTPSASPVPPASLALQSSPLAGVRILVVDDDADTRDLLAEALGAAGAHVTTAHSARAALDELMSNAADVLVSDIGMPGEDGLSLMRQIRAIPGMLGRIPAIALSAFAHEADRKLAAEAGFQMHLAKPVELSVLEAELVRLAAQAASRSSAL
jgi:signal transduction histidine kinase/CheY-like chemotaxis protein